MILNVLDRRAEAKIEELDKAKSNEIIPNEVNKGKGYLKEEETTLASN